MPAVLIVDDDESIRETVRFLLEDAGYETHVARNGVDALDLLGRLEPAVVLLDLVMPAMTGIELLQRVQLEPQLARHAYIIWSASRVEVPADLIQSLDLMSIPKPANIDEIQGAIQTAARRIMDGLGA